MKTICAIISVVISTMVEANAVGVATPRRITARAPIKMPPNCEKGRISPALSRISLPQMKVAARENLRRGTSTYQALPRSAIKASPKRQSSAKPSQPTEAMAASTAEMPT